MPPSCLVTDENDEHKHSVEVLDKDGKPVSRPVTVGRKTEKQIEILDGLKAGDKVVLEPSKDKEDRMEAGKGQRDKKVRIGRATPWASGFRRQGLCRLQLGQGRGIKGRETVEESLRRVPDVVVRLRFRNRGPGLLAILARWAAAEDRPLRPPALAETGPKPKPIDPPAPEEIQRSIHRGLLFLLTHQNKDGSWGSANITRPGDIYSPVPGAHQAFKAAVTAMCISTLIETGGSEPDVPAALDRAEDWTFAPPAEGPAGHARHDVQLLDAHVCDSSPGADARAQAG